MKRYWMNTETGTTMTTWGDNEPVTKNWVEITKEEKEARDRVWAKAWAKVYNGAE